MWITVFSIAVFIAAALSAAAVMVESPEEVRQPKAR